MPPVPVLPVAAAEVWEALPVGPEAPPLPLLAVFDDCGLAVTAPVVPPVAEALVVTAPELPVVALPVEEAVAAPVEPPVTLAVAGPELPLETITWTAPVPPPAPPPVPPEKVVPAEEPPVDPLVGAAAAAPPVPLVAVTMGETVAAPVLPLVPPVAVAVPDALPLVALPFVLETLVDDPVAPPAPVPPLVDVPVPCACPLPPLGPVTAGATVLVVVDGERFRVATSARTPRTPDMAADGTRRSPVLQPSAGLQSQVEPKV